MADTPTFCGLNHHPSRDKVSHSHLRYTLQTETEKARTMPVVLRYQGFKFFFYSNEGNPLEPPHIHVRNSDGEAKFWLSPDVQLARNDGFSARTLKEISTVVLHNKDQLERAWHDYFA